MGGGGRKTTPWGGNTFQIAKSFLSHFKAVHHRFGPSASKMLHSSSQKDLQLMGKYR